MHLNCLCGALLHFVRAGVLWYTDGLFVILFHSLPLSDNPDDNSEKLENVALHYYNLSLQRVVILC